MEIRLQLSGKDIAGLLASVCEYNRLAPLRVEFVLDAENHVVGPIDAAAIRAEVVCEHPGLTVRVEPESERNLLREQMEEIISHTPRA